MSNTEKEFVIKNVFKDVSSMKEKDEQNSKIEEHFGIPWKINVERQEDHLGLWLFCEKEKNGKEWSIEVSYDMKICSADGKTVTRPEEYTFEHSDTSGFGEQKFVQWDKMMKDYVIDDTLNVEINVKIKKMFGIEKKKLMNFDESMKEFSDVVLVVENQKFHLLKLFLARQSTYFEAMFLRNFEESKTEEIALTEIKAEDFQNFLEVLHGEPAIDDNTVTGILHLADMYDTKTVIAQCEKFLVKESEKSAKEKLELAVKYKLEMLKSKCLIGIKTIADIRSVVPGDMTQMDHNVMACLFQKSLSYQT